MKKIIAALLSAALAVSVFGTVFGLADEKLFGDVNGSGTVTVEDALLVLQYSVGKIPFTDEQKDLARVSDEKGRGRGRRCRRSHDFAVFGWKNHRVPPQGR